MNKWKETTEKLSLWMFLESLGDSVACDQEDHIQEVSTTDAELVMQNVEYVKFSKDRLFINV